MHIYSYLFKERLLTSSNLFAKALLIIVGITFFFSIIPVTAQSPTFTLKATPQSGQAPLIVNFETIMEQRWDYNGDGKIDDTITSTSDPVTFIYTTPGTYSPRVSVKQNNKTIVSNPVTINVTAAPAPTPTATPAPTATPTPAPEPTGPAFFISPAGSDSNPGTSSRPWKTFSHAISQLAPGDTLILKSGTYTKSTTGLPYIDCAFNSRSGSEESPITIKAENERQAHLQSDGTQSAFRMRNCWYWTVEGLQGSSRDNEPGQASIFQVEKSHNVILRRLLAHHTNRCYNDHAISIEQDSSDVLVEESEAYYFHRIALLPFTCTRCVFRRNYVNGRGYEKASTALCPSNISNRDINPDGADGGQAFYGGTDTIIENGIVEDVEIGGFYSPGRGGNRCFGCISLNCNQGANFSSGTHPNDVYIENYVGVDNYMSMFSRATDLTITNATFYSNATTGLRADKPSNVTLDNANVTATNVLTFNNWQGFYLIGQDSILINYSNSHGNSTNYYPSESNISDNSGNIRNSVSITPAKMGLETNQCIVYVPPDSNMKGEGKGGGDIGANVVYRYVDGILTDEKLWDQTTGQFPCGAIVSGINDIEGDSCFDVYERLNVGVNGCPIP